MPESVQIVVNEGVAKVFILRPDMHNAFNEVVIAEITQAITDLGKNDEVRVIVLASEGKSFCAGADVNWMKRMVDYSFEENVADANTLANMLRTIRECPKPVIARVHGAAYGGGVGLVAACDMAVALADAKFCLSEVKLGIIPAVISPYVLEKIGPAHARRYALTAEVFDGHEALRIGLISAIANTTHEMDGWIDKVSQTILSNAPQAVAASKRVIREVYPVEWDRVQRLTTERIAERRVSAEGQEGLKAFLEKRNPYWKQP